MRHDPVFDLGEGLLDRIEVEPGAGRFDDAAQGRRFVAAEVVDVMVRWPPRGSAPVSDAPSNLLGWNSLAVDGF